MGGNTCHEAFFRPPEIKKNIDFPTNNSKFQSDYTSSNTKSGIFNYFSLFLHV